MKFNSRPTLNRFNDSVLRIYFKEKKENKQTYDYLESYLIDYRTLCKIAPFPLYYFFDSEIFSIFSDLQYGQNNIFGVPSIDFTSIYVYNVLMLLCHKKGMII